LRSKARDPNPVRGQFHPADEEFYCIAGDFTFDGTTWFGPGSYAFYPAYFVHGSNVHVRGGYEVYLRLSGTSEIIWEESLRSNLPYLKDGFSSDDTAIQEPDIHSEATLGDCSSVASATTRLLRASVKSGAGTTLISSRSSFDELRIEADDYLELFAISGSYTINGEESLPAQAYCCEQADRAGLSLSAQEAGAILVSHGSSLEITPR
jgi:hypothetical protein